MKKIEVKYNPFLISTEIMVGGKKPSSNSSLNFGKLRLQEWVGNLPDILIGEYSDKNFEIDFTGTLSDFEDLEIAFKSQSDKVCVTAFNHHRTPDVADVEADIDKIFDEIKNGKVNALRDESIIAAFEKAKNQEFEINVVATMSSGKSSLINAILDKQLMPVANKATTATIVKITDTDQNNFSATAYNMFGEEIFRDDDISYNIMKQWNKNDNISIIEINGRIPCVESVGMKLVLIDTPGPNNSRDERHKAMTYKMLSDSDKSLVLFVMNASQLETDDEKAFLDYVCDCMRSGGKQSRERYIIAVNKMDLLDPVEESVEDTLNDAVDVLEKRNIYEPNIFPVSAQAAFETRTKPMNPRVLPSYTIDYIESYPSLKFDSYYNYSHLPHVVRFKLEEDLKKADDDTKIEIYSGIVSIEKAIGQYINKYARTIKVYDLVQSFNDRLTELAAIATIQEEIRQNSAKKEELDQTIKEIKNKIQLGQSAQVLTTMIDKIDFTKDVENEIDKYILSLNTKIDKIIFSYNNSSRVLKYDAEKQIKDIQNESDTIISQLNVRIETILNNTFIRLYTTIVDQYKSYVEDLGIVISSNTLNINPLNFVADDLSNISDILNEKTDHVDESYWRDKEEKYSVWVEDTRWFLAPWTWKRRGDHWETRTKTVQEYVSKYVDYVDMSEVVSSYFEPIQLQLYEAKKASLEHVKNETKRIKLFLNQKFLEIDQILERKLNDLQESIDKANTTEEAIKEQKEDLKWMQDVIVRVNKLVKF